MFLKGQNLKVKPTEENEKERKKKAWNNKKKH